MIPRTYSSEGIILSRKNYSEADRILTIFSKNYGKLQMLAKGVRKVKSRKRGAIEVFSEIKFSAARTKGLDLITEVETLDNHPVIRKNLKKVSLAYFFVEVTQRLINAEEKNLDAYYLLSRYLEELENEIKLRELKDRFLHGLFVTLGYWPAGKELTSPDSLLAEVVERAINSQKVGKKLFE